MIRCPLSQHLALEHLTAAAMRVLADEPRAPGETPSLAATIEWRIASIVDVARMSGGDGKIRRRAMEKLAALAAVGLLSIGDAPVQLGPRPRKRWPATSIPCESCGAPAGKSCTLRDGRSATKPHLPRRRAKEAQ